jgi:hypothetical protein
MIYGLDSVHGANYVVKATIFPHVSNPFQSYISISFIFSKALYLSRLPLPLFNVDHLEHWPSCHLESFAVVPSCADHRQRHEVLALPLNSTQQSSPISSSHFRTAGVPWAFSPVLGLGVQPLWPRFYETVIVSYSRFPFYFPLALQADELNLCSSVKTRICFPSTHAERSKATWESRTRPTTSRLRTCVTAVFLISLRFLRMESIPRLWPAA